ncbi:MAG: choloylglycine hydrolase [Clostridium sp.]|uniref:choloylglycine hydrolase n=1 Tax=Clostridium chrysemydis TaxID=2665504 RepID=UPI003EE43B82
MCTGLTLVTKDGDHLFGRNMDIEFTFGQAVGIIPRNFEYINMSTGVKEKTKNAIIGMLTIMDGHPMLADGFNEKGLAIAGLNFPGYNYNEPELIRGKVNIPAYDFMLWVLSNFDDLNSVKEKVNSVNLMDTQINEKAPAPTLHWMITDKTGDSIVVEHTKHGLKVFDNKVGVLTNSPTFDWHETNLRQYMGMYADQAGETTWGAQQLNPLGVGAGSVGLPGDFTPASRFVRVAFLRHFALENCKDEVDIGEFYHILNNVAMVKGAVRTPQYKNDVTAYSSCMNLEKGIYHYNTYNNNQINAIDMNKENLDAKEIKLFVYKDSLNINNQN